MTYAHPEAFLLCIPLFAWLLYQNLVVKNKNKSGLLYGDLNTFLKDHTSFRSLFVFVPKLLQYIAIIFMIIALARPQSFRERINQTQKGLDIMLVLDISLSMMIPDMKQEARMTRLTSAKQVLKNFIQNRKQDRIGLIVFSGESFTLVPLTSDHDLLQKKLHQVKINPLIKQGTALGVALANAALRLQHSPLKSRVLIFLTDGENNSGFIDPEAAISIVKKHKIKVYTVGVGSQSGIFYINPTKSQRPGQRVQIKSSINKTLMKRISSQTGGIFFMANQLDSLKQIFKKINSLETYKIQINKWTKKQEHFKKFAINAFFLYLISVILSLSLFFKGI